MMMVVGWKNVCKKQWWKGQIWVFSFFVFALETNLNNFFYRNITHSKNGERIAKQNRKKKKNRNCNRNFWRKSKTKTKNLIKMKSFYFILFFSSLYEYSADIKLNRNFFLFCFSFTIVITNISDWKLEIDMNKIKWFFCFVLFLVNFRSIGWIVWGRERKKCFKVKIFVFVFGNFQTNFNVFFFHLVLGSICWFSIFSKWNPKQHQQNTWLKSETFVRSK